MLDAIKIVLSLAIVSLLSGIVLGGLNEATKDQIELQLLNNKIMPAVKKVMSEADNDMLTERKTIEKKGKDGKVSKLFVFPAKKGSEPYAVGMEFFGQGFGGAVGVVVGFDLASGNLVGLDITSMSETPGVGTRAKDDSFTSKFKGLSKDTVFKVKADGGQVDAVTGATFTSRAVCEAVREGVTFFGENKDKILEEIKK